MSSPRSKKTVPPITGATRLEYDLGVLARRTKQDGSVAALRLDDDGHYFVIEGVAAEVWAMIDGKNTLDRICERYPVVMHGVSLSIASTAPPNFDYLQGLKDLARRVQPKWLSDHLCWTGVHGKNLHDLLPIPYTREALDHVVSRVQLVQDFLGRAIVLENVSTYVQFNNSEMTEWEFLSELSRRTGCWLLFDINNVYVSAFNHGYDPLTFLNGIPADRVVQFHMAGHSHMGTHIIDTHDHPVCEDVWDLYVAALKRFGRVSTMIERDDNIPPLAELVDELEHARSIASEVFTGKRLAAAE